MAEQRDVLLAGAGVEVAPNQDAAADTPAGRAKRWDMILRRPDLDYSDIFTDDIGTLPGLTIWEIENFYPAEVEDSKY